MQQMDDEIEEGYPMDENQQLIYDEHNNGYMCSAVQDEQQLQLRNPKVYGQFPSCYMNKIPAAGKQTYKSESVYNIMSMCWVRKTEWLICLFEWGVVVIS